jgi:hypothetical protein
MHFVSDVLFGITLGLWSVAVTVHVLRSTYEAETDDPVVARDAGADSDPRWCSELIDSR